MVWAKVLQDIQIVDELDCLDSMHVVNSLTGAVCLPPKVYDWGCMIDQSVLYGPFRAKANPQGLEQKEWLAERKRAIF